MSTYKRGRRKASGIGQGDSASKMFAPDASVSEVMEFMDEYRGFNFFAETLKLNDAPVLKVRGKKRESQRVYQGKL